MARATKTLMTAEEFALLPDDGVGRELVAGEVIEMTPGAVESARISSRVVRRLGGYVEEHKLGETYVSEPGFILSRDPDCVRAPDVAFLSAEQVPTEPTLGGFYEGAPDLAVEVVSPTDRAGEIEAKVADYLKAGTRLVWVVYPKERFVRVHRSSAESFLVGEKGTLAGDPVLPGFTLTVADILAR